MGVLDKAIQAVLKMIKKKPEYRLVWKNAKPKASFANQTTKVAGLDDASVDGVRIVAKRNSSDTDNAFQTTDIPLNAISGQIASGCMSFITGNNGKIYAYYRYLGVAADRKSIVWSYGYDATPSADQENNNHVVPVAVYAIVNGFRNGGGTA